MQMFKGKNQRTNLWLLIVTAVIFWTIGTAFDRGLLASNDDKYKGLKTFADVIELIERTYVDQVDTKELIVSAIQGMVSSLDPHSTFLVPEDFKEMQVEAQGEFTGIGIQITMRDKLVTVISPIEGTPAYKAGIEAGDKIIEVDGEAVKDLRDAVKKMRGPRGTTVTVKLLRKGEANPLEFTLTRDKIPIRSVRHSMLRPGYAFIRIINFNENTADDLEKTLAEIEAGSDPIKGMVLDLRYNPGGLLDQAVDVSDLFLDEGEIVSMKGRDKRNTRVFRAHSDDSKRLYPMVVLINGGSASASEIVAGALQDNKRALILGTTSFGKGSVQSLETLRDGNGLKLTIARYYSPSGRSIQAEGIVPDVVVERRRLDSDAESLPARRTFKESDLENHLESRPLQPEAEGDAAEEPAVSEESPEGDQESETPPQDDALDGPIDTDRLKTDNQVMRALEILVGYDILKETKTSQTSTETGNDS